jgi:hypothetical protein
MIWDGMGKFWPCPECFGGEVSCCEGSERHGQIGDGDESRPPRRERQ